MRTVLTTYTTHHFDSGRDRPVEVWLQWLLRPVQHRDASRTGYCERETKVLMVYPHMRPVLHRDASYSEGETKEVKCCESFTR